MPLSYQRRRSCQLASGVNRTLATIPPRWQNQAMRQPPEICWSCQEPLTLETAVSFDRSGETFIPCCRGCWRKVDPAAKLRFMQSIREHDQREARDAVLKPLMEKLLANLPDGDGLPDWLTGRN